MKKEQRLQFETKRKLPRHQKREECLELETKKSCLEFKTKKRKGNVSSSRPKNVLSSRPKKIVFSLRPKTKKNVLSSIPKKTGTSGVRDQKKERKKGKILKSRFKKPRNFRSLCRGLGKYIRQYIWHQPILNRVICRLKWNCKTSAYS